MPHTPPIPQRRVRQFLPQEFEVTTWEKIQPFYDQLLERTLSSPADLRQWFLDRSELESVLADVAGWRYINTTRDTTNATYRAQYESYLKNILPKMVPMAHQLDKKALACPHAQALQQETGFDILMRCMANNLRIYRSENVPLMTQVALEAQKYGQITGAMTVQLHDEEVTLQQAAVHLEDQDRALREQVYTQVGARRLQDADALNALYSTLIQRRHEIAVNAGFENFRDYAFVALNRFDYTPADCFAFHEAVEKEVVPLLNDLAQERKDLLGVDVLEPWDQLVDPTGQPPLKPFQDVASLLQNTIAAFDRLDPFLGDCLRTMQAMDHFDLASRKGKAPGGYNYPLDETGVPFIFMNATSTLRDLVTLLHEGGHAVHSFLTKELLPHNFRHTPSELAELASMSMELLTMDHWDLFFEQEQDLKRAKRQHLSKILETLAWVATIDQFQHWVYEHPHHTLAQREAAWVEIFDRFSDSVTDWEGHAKNFVWQKQLHLFEVPFYYIEYGIAQLGALAVWKRFKEHPQQGLKDYLEALKLGYTRTVPAVYAAAGISFDFSRPYIGELVQFVRNNMT